MTKKKIMFVDDDKDLLEVMKALCSVYGYEFQGENDVAGALEKIPFLKPDLIVLDLNFNNGYDGTSFLMSYKERVVTRDYNPPVLVLSGVDLPETIEFVVDLGAKGYLSKPFDPRQLMAMINDYLLDRPIRAESSHFAQAVM